MLNEVELIELIDDVFGRLGINVSIKINNRKILAGIAELIGEADKITDITVAIDKLDKIGLDNVNKELEDNGISPESIELLQPILMLGGDNGEKLDKLRHILTNSTMGQKGIEETETILSYLADCRLAASLELDLTLARGLNYYTGAIIEVKARDVQIGSISGGGRYDNLTGVFGLQGVSGVGVSFGADRIYDVLDTLGLFPTHSAAATQILFAAFDEEGRKYSLPIVRSIRRKGIAAELYPDNAKIKKQMQYANDKRIPFVAIVGDEEIKSHSVMLKNMETGEQKLVSIDNIVQEIRL